MENEKSRRVLKYHTGMYVKRISEVGLDPKKIFTYEITDTAITNSQLLNDGIDYKIKKVAGWDGPVKNAVPEPAPFEEDIFL